MIKIDPMEMAIAVLNDCNFSKKFSAKKRAKADEQMAGAIARYLHAVFMAWRNEKYNTNLKIEKAESPKIIVPKGTMRSGN